MADGLTDLDTPGGRLAWARERAGYADAAQFARAVKIKEVTYRAYENNQNRFARHAPEFARRLGVPTDWLLEGGPLPTGVAEERQPFQHLSPASDLVEVIGSVRAGHWREQVEWSQDERYLVDFGPAALEGHRRFALIVEGHSMEKVFPSGTELECYWIKFEDRQVLVPQDGDLVIVERRNGDLYETTCKRLVVTPEGAYELHAESDRPEFQEPLRIGRPDRDHHIDIETEIIGIVDRAVQRHFRRGRRVGTYQ